MYIISLKYTVALNKIEEHLEEHVEYLKKNYKAKHFIASGRKVPRDGGIILATIKSRETLDKIIKEDPFYIHQLADYHITEFIPSMTSDKLTSLKE
ncbi:YciI family protein [Halosquirtibacter laminarini]|uniref:YciI family protein n=1 Tax=Halosquirtibacter laminarini TaxID=3374600 RepID=A0AC61NR35_9BACT|nr:YciI family protein [Prolixibacteraceae bacterium]